MNITFSKNIDPRIFLTQTSNRHYVTGFPTLDKMLGGGFHAGSINVLQGTPGTGKITLMKAMVKNLEVNKAKQPFALSPSMEMLELWGMNFYDAIAFVKQNRTGHKEVNLFDDLFDPSLDSNADKRSRGLKALRKHLINSNGCAIIVKTKPENVGGNLVGGIDIPTSMLADNVFNITHYQHNFNIFEVKVVKTRSIDEPKVWQFKIDEMGKCAEYFAD